MPMTPSETVRRILVIAACCLAAPGSPTRAEDPPWAQFYRAAKLLPDSRCEDQAVLLEDAIQRQPNPQFDVALGGGQVIADYFPQLDLAFAYWTCGQLEKAQSAQALAWRVHRQWSRYEGVAMKDRLASRTERLERLGRFLAQAMTQQAMDSSPPERGPTPKPPPAAPPVVAEPTPPSRAKPDEATSTKDATTDEMARPSAAPPVSTTVGHRSQQPVRGALGRTATEGAHVPGLAVGSQLQIVCRCSFERSGTLVLHLGKSGDRQYLLPRGYAEVTVNGEVYDFPVRPAANIDNELAAYQQLSDDASSKAINLRMTWATGDQLARIPPVWVLAWLLFPHEGNAALMQHAKEERFDQLVAIKTVFFAERQNQKLLELAPP